MDFDDDDFNKPTKAPPRQSRFAPKARLKTQPAKPKDEPKPVTEDAEAPAVAVVKKEAEVIPTQTVDKMDVDVASSSAVKESGGVVEEETRNVSSFDASSSKIDMVTTAEVEEDYVVAEYDVYYTPPNSDYQLYVTQYPLRPSWRPYELEQRCKEVRVKPTSSKVEVDLTIEVESDNYDRDTPTAGRVQMQTLSSSGRPPSVAGYAVGLLKGKKLYLNPIHSVVQLRPSTEYLGFDLKRKNVKIAVKEVDSTNVGPSKKQNTEKDPGVVESWIPLKYYSSADDLAQTYMRKMVTEESNPLQFSMKPYDYLNYLCPGTKANKVASSGLSRRSLLSLPLEERLKTLLIKGPHIHRFDAIKHLTPDDPVEDVLKIVQQHADLVQGVWVGKSRERYTGFEILVRDYALFLFSQNPVLKDSELDILERKKLGGKSVAKTVICEIAVERPSCKDWKFKVSTDVAFMKLYPDIVEHQRNIFEDCGKQILEKLRPHDRKRPRPPVRSDESMGKETNEARSVCTSMSKEARELLMKVLEKFFSTHKVCSFQTIHQGLRDIAVSMSNLQKAGAKSNAVLEAVMNIVDAPQEDVQAIISQYAVNVHNLYLSKSSPELPELNPLRNVVIDLFRKREPGAKLKKGEIMEAAMDEPATSEFQKVINEYCISKGGAWVLKSCNGPSALDWQNTFKAAKLS